MPSDTYSTSFNRALKCLLQAQSPETGSFSYQKTSQDASLEASGWAALALSQDENEQTRGPALKAMQFLHGAQNQDGGWSTRPDAGRSDWSSAPSLMALRLLQAEIGAQSGAPPKKKLLRSIENGLFYLLDARYFQKPATRLVLLVSKGARSLDKDRGWPWDPDCFHWIEPTAYALLALKLPGLPTVSNTERADIEHAIEKANGFILDHACRGGGWNHGNDITLGAALPAYRLTTAEALLALQDLKEEKKVKDGLDYLSTWSDKNTSSLSLAMSALALMAHGRSAQSELNYLVERQGQDGSFTANLTTTAISALALAAGGKDKSPLFLKK